MGLKQNGNENWVDKNEKYLWNRIRLHKKNVKVYEVEWKGVQYIYKQYFRYTTCKFYQTTYLKS